MLVQSSSPMARISKLQITTTSPLFSGEVGQGYLFAFNAINGILPYTWSTPGPIPAGMILNPSTGALMGTPSASFSNVFPVTVMDALGSTATANFGLTIVSALAITTTSPLTAAIQGVLYSNTFAESGGIPPFVWSFNGAPTGSNTWGLSGPTLSGTPANAETDIIPVRVTDSLGALAQGNFSLTVQAVQAAIPTFSPPGGTFSGPTLVSMACTTPGNTIFFTTNGSIPTTASTQYSTPVLVSATETIKAIAIAAGFTQSAVGSATYTINAIPAASQFKFNPGDYVQGNGATAANLNSAVAPFVGGVNATFIGIAPWYYWDALEQTTLGTYDFSTIITDFNAWQAAVAANGNSGAVGHFIPMVGDYHNSALTPAGLSTYNPRFGGIPQYILNNPATYGSMPNNGFGGWIPTSWNGTTWGFQRAALWRAAVTARRNALAQALAATSFTTTAGPYSGQTFTFDSHPLIEMYADFSPTDLGTIQSSPDIPADYTFPAWNNSFLNRVGPNTGFTKTITALMPGFGGNDFLGHNDPTAQGALVAAMVASPTAQSCTDVFANGALTFAQSYLTGLTWNGSAFVPGGTDYRGHIDSSPSIQGFDYANQLGSNTANTAATVTVIANQCVNTLKSNRRLWAAVNSTGAYVPSYFTSVIQPGVKAALPCITLLPTCEMFAPAGLTGSASGTTVSLSWTTYTGVGTGLSYNIYDSGTLVGNSASGTLTLTGVSVGTHNYTVGMVNANGTGAQSAVFSLQVGWQTLKVGGGGFVRGLIIAADGTMVGRTDTAGAYLYNSGANTWNQLVNSSSLPSAYLATNPFALGSETGGQGVYELAIAPSNSSVMYMNFGGYIFSSANKGTSWTQTAFVQDTSCNPNDGNAEVGQKMAVDPANSNIVYVGTEGTGLRSTANGGSTWATVSGVPTGTGAGITGILFDPSSSVVGGVTQGIYASRNGTGVYHSTNGGSTWALTSGGPVDVEYACISTTGVYYYCVGDNYANVWSYNGTWTKLIAGSADSFQGIAINPFNQSELVVTNFNGQVSISYNGGTTWSGINTNTALVSTDIPWLKAANLNAGIGPAFYLSAGGLQFSPITNGLLYQSAGTGMWQMNVPAGATSGTALTWTDFSVGIENLVANAILVPTGGTPILANWDRPFFDIASVGTYSSTYGPVNSLTIQAGWSLDYASSSPSTVVGLSTWGDNQSGITTDNGVSWTIFSATASNYLQSFGLGGGCIAASTPTNIIWAPAGGTAPSYTTNGGTSWNTIAISGIASWSGFQGQYFTNQRSVTADRVNATTFYLYFAGNGVYKTSDGGATWTQQLAGYIESNHSQAGSASMILSVPGNAGHLFYTSGLLSGSTLTIPVNEPFYRSTNGGVSWTAVSNVLAVSCFGFGKVATGQTYPAVYIYGYVNSVLGVWQSVDNCVTWTNLGAFPDGVVVQVSAISGDPNTVGRVYVGFHGGGYAYYG